MADATQDNLPTELDDVEVFRVGDWTSANGYRHQWTTDDIDDIIDRYTNQDLEHPWVAPVVLGHPVDNSPAYGWVEKLYRVGDVMMARLVKLNKSFVQMLKDGSFANRSIMIDGDNLLWHIGFLGAVPPAVDGLAPIEFGKGRKKGHSFTFSLIDGAGVSVPATTVPDPKAAGTQTVDEAAVAQQARATTYGIRVLVDKGNVIKPTAFSNLTDDQFADPVNYRYPIATEALMRASLKTFYWYDSEYSEVEKIIIAARMFEAMKALGMHEECKYFNRQRTGGPGVAHTYSLFAAGTMNPTLQAFVDWLKTTFNEDTANQAMAKIAELEASLAEQLGAWLSETFGAENGTSMSAKLTELLTAQGTADTTATGDAGTAAAAGTATPPTPTLAPGTQPAYSKNELAMQQRIAQLEKDRRADQHAVFCDGLVKDGRIIPAQKPLIMKQLENAFASDAAGVTVGSYDANKQLFTDLPKQLTLGEVATPDRVAKFGKGKSKKTASNVDPDSLAQREKVEAYAAKHGKSYQQAMSELMKQGEI